MVSKKEKFTGNSGRGQRKEATWKARKEGGRERERERENDFSSAEDKYGKHLLKILQCLQSIKKRLFSVISEGQGGRPWRSDSVGSKATLCGVSVVKQFGLTVGKNLNLRRIWTLTDPRRHESVQILKTCHL